jgi:hypothetical protein
MSINVRSNVSALKLMEMQLRGVVEKMGQTWAIAFDGPATARRPYPTLRPRKGPAGKQPTNAEVLQYLEASGRTLTKLDAAFKARALSYVLARFRGRAIPQPQNVMFALAPFVKETFLARALHSGADIEGEIPANSAGWTERKRKLGLSTNKMKASGQLASWLKDSRFRVVRVK